MALMVHEAIYRKGEKDPKADIHRPGTFLDLDKTIQDVTNNTEKGAEIFRPGSKDRSGTGEYSKRVCWICWIVGLLEER
jgi:hypothetical protein